MKTIDPTHKTNTIAFFVCVLLVTIVITIVDYSRVKEINKQVQEQEQNDYSDALIKNCEPYNK